LKALSAPLSPNARLRYGILAPLIDSFPDGQTFLEIGPGQGALATILARRFHYVGYEPDEQSFSIARRRLASVQDGRIVNQPLPDEPDRPYDIVGAFEVLEHMEDDARTLRSWVNWIRPGGYLLLSVPAHPHRFAAGDAYGGHYRRYTRRRLTRLLTDGGLEHIEIRSYGFPLGYLLESTRNVILGRRLSAAPASPLKRTAGSGRLLQLDARLAPLIWAVTLPFAYLQRPFANGEFGIGYVIKARK
jgi:SAM-dependent methyltransferase